MKITGSFTKINRETQDYAFPTGRPRRINPTERRSIRWPKSKEVATEYVQYWREKAGDVLRELCLSKATLDQVASHVSRKNGELRMTDKALASRSGRSLRSTERDLARLRDLGFLQVTYEGGSRKQERVRVLRLTVPDRVDGPANVSPFVWSDGPANVSHPVGGLDTEVFL